LPERVDFREPEVQELVGALEAELHALYGRPDQDAPADDAFDDGVFVVLRGPDGAALACGGLRVAAPGVGEIKRMFTVPSARGRGHAATVLASLVDFAERRGLERLILETGVKQTAALALYAGAGWTRCAPFGPYEDAPESICFERRLGGR
jgi:putative acetyltransferase